MASLPAISTMGTRRTTPSGSGSMVNMPRPAADFSSSGMLASN